MSKKTRYWLLMGGGIALAAVVVLLILYAAAQSKPAFYRQALAVDADSLEKGSDRMLQQITAMVGAARKESDWEVLFTAEEINGWLAVDMPKNHPKLLPPWLRDPRVDIHSKGITLACECDQTPVSTILSLTVEVYMPIPNTIGIRFLKARAGLLPIPLKKVLDWFSQIARDMQWKLTWRSVGVDPVAIISLSSDEDESPVQLERLRLGEGEIFIAGKDKE